MTTATSATSYYLILPQSSDLRSLTCLRIRPSISATHRMPLGRTEGDHHFQIIAILLNFFDLQKLEELPLDRLRQSSREEKGSWPFFKSIYFSIGTHPLGWHHTSLRYPCRSYIFLSETLQKRLPQERSL